MTVRVSRDFAEISFVIRNASSPFGESSLRQMMIPYYSSVFGEDFLDDSFVIFSEAQPVACAIRGVMLGKMGYFDQPFRVEFAPNFSTLKTARDVLNRIAKEVWVSAHQIREMHLEIPVLNERTNLLLESLLSKTTDHGFHIEAEVALDQPPESIEGDLRKAHRQSLAKGRKEIERIEVFFGGIDDQVFSAFQNLHFQAAGRRTRSEMSWQIQKQAVNNREASVVTLSQSSVVIGAAFSWLSATTGLYGSAAYDRRLFTDFPVSHAGVFEAMTHSRSIGRSRYILGEAYSVRGSEKEKGIALFKRGFSSHRKYFHRLRLLP